MPALIATGAGVHVEEVQFGVADDFEDVGVSADEEARFAGEDFAAGGYASTLVPRALLLPPFTPAVGDVLVDGALQLLQEFGDSQ